MKIGWMWFDDDPGRDTEEKVALAIVAYRNKHGHRPNACYLNARHACQAQVGPVKVTRLPNILPNHFLLGIEEEKENDPHENPDPVAEIKKFREAVSKIIVEERNGQH